jgi:hypothetical protein
MISIDICWENINRFTPVHYLDKKNKEKLLFFFFQYINLKNNYLLKPYNIKIKLLS